MDARALVTLIWMATRVRNLSPITASLQANNEPNSIADSANCCSGSHNTPQTCPPSGVQYYSFFSASFYGGPCSERGYSIACPLQRTAAPTPTSTLMTKAAEPLCGPADRSKTAITQLLSARSVLYQISPSNVVNRESNRMYEPVNQLKPWPG